MNVPCCGCWVCRAAACLTIAGSRASAASLLATQLVAVAESRATVVRERGRICGLGLWDDSADVGRGQVESKTENEQHPAPGREPREIGQRRPAFTNVEGQVCRHIAGDEQTH